MQVQARNKKQNNGSTRTRTMVASEGGGMSLWVWKHYGGTQRGVGIDNAQGYRKRLVIL